MEWRKDRGLLTIAEVANILDIPTSTLQYHVRLGYCTAPSTKIEGLKRPFYTEKDVESLKSYFKQRQKHDRHMAD